MNFKFKFESAGLRNLTGKINQMDYLINGTLEHRVEFIKRSLEQRMVEADLGDDLEFALFERESSHRYAKVVEIRTSHKLYHQKAREVISSIYKKLKSQFVLS